MSLDQGHTARKWLHLGLKRGGLTGNPVSFLTNHTAPCHMPISARRSTLGQEPIPDISGAEWRHLERRVTDATTENEEENEITL